MHLQLLEILYSNSLKIIEPTDRPGTVALVAEAAKTSGPFDAAIIGMGNGRYELFNEELLGPLLPSLKIVACVNAGYSEFDLEWFTKNKVYVTNTLYAVAEPTADITVMLILNTLRDFSKFEKLVKTGSWRSVVKVPPTDPHGLLLGIVGMGKIGKVRRHSPHVHPQGCVLINCLRSTLLRNLKHSA